MTGASPAQFHDICAHELTEIERRRKFYLGNRPPPTLKGKIVIVVDDGLATGNTMRAALRAVRQREPQMIVMAVPVAPPGVERDFRDEADFVVCLATPEPFGAVGYFYQDFDQVSDAEVIALLDRCRKPTPADAA